MKKNFTLILLGFLPFFALSQIPQAFNYQAAVRNTDGEIQFNTTADFKIEILQNDSIVYSENHINKETGKTGVVNFRVGKGDILTGDFSQIDWNQGQLQIRVHLKLTGGQEEEMGTADIVAVPFALYAQNSGDSYWEKNDSTSNIYFLDGNIGIGNDRPSEKVVIGDDIGNLTQASSALVIGEKADTSFSTLIFAEDGNNLGAIFWTNSNFVIPNSFRFLLKANGNLNQVLTIRDVGNVGIGTDYPSSKLHVNGGAVLGRTQGNNPDLEDNVLVLSDANQAWEGGLIFANKVGPVGGGIKFSSAFSSTYPSLRIGEVNLDNVNEFTEDYFYLKKGNVGIGTDNPSAKLDVNGRTKTTCLEITGGCDGAEYFEIKPSIKIEPGSLVIIDEENEGQLKISTKPYDQRVAGIISGAGGVKPGIVLEQKEVLEGNELVSLWGRVYVKATTENGNIKPGDLLTSSYIPGHVMKATKKRKSRGAVIGKALSGLSGGEGMVLVLIQHQ